LLPLMSNKWFIRRTRALRPKKVEKSGHAYSN
jgi:hypothetical protein